MKKLILISILIIAASAAFYIYILLKPSNNRIWEFGFETLPEIRIANNLVTINNVRNWNYSKTDVVSQEYIELTYNLDNLEKVWLLVEPFSKWDGVAHTYFVFDFTDQEPVSFSIEARREKGEQYNAFIGAFNKYELIYMWGTERDFTGRRIYKDNANVYMYPLNISRESSQKLFLELAKSTEELRNSPKFYNTLTSNCTNNLANHANKVKQGSIPWNIARILPGFSDEFLYAIDYIPNNEKFEDIKNKYYITNIVKENYTKENFSQELRRVLQGE